MSDFPKGSPESQMMKLFSHYLKALMPEVKKNLSQRDIQTQDINFKYRVFHEAGAVNVSVSAWVKGNIKKAIKDKNQLVFTYKNGKLVGDNQLELPEAS